VVICKLKWSIYQSLSPKWKLISKPNQPWLWITQKRSGNKKMLLIRSKRLQFNSYLRRTTCRGVYWTRYRAGLSNWRKKGFRNCRKLIIMSIMRRTFIINKKIKKWAITCHKWFWSSTLIEEFWRCLGSHAWWGR
jgi:hypothetical protein